MINKIKQIKKRLHDIWSYFTGNYRFYIYNSLLSKYLLRKHIRHQYDWRLLAMKPKCYTEGACVACGCITPNLQMASKGCEENCYPPMMSKTAWKIFLHAHIAVEVKGDFWRLSRAKSVFGEPIYDLYKNNNHVNSINYNKK